MSVQATTWAWSLRGLPTHLRLTLLAIADACNADGFGFPGQGRLASMCECSDRQIRANIAELTARGLLTPAIRPGAGTGRHTNCYQLTMLTTEATGSTLPLNPVDKSVDKSVDNSEATGSTLPLEGGGNRKYSVGQPEVQRRHSKEGTSVLNKREATRPLRGSPAAVPETPTDEPKTATPRAPKGTRLAIEALPEDWRTYCTTKRPDLDPVATFEDFSDFWRAKPGRDGMKLDWAATWRRWIRHEAMKGGAAATSSGAAYQTWTPDPPSTRKNPANAAKAIGGLLAGLAGRNHRSPTT